MKRPWQKAMQNHRTTPGEFLTAAIIDVVVILSLLVFAFVCLGWASGAKGAELVPGAVLVSRNQDERLNADIPGTMNHLAIVARDGDVIESMVPVGVQKITMATYLSRPYETPLVLLPKDRQLGERAADKAATLVGTKFRKASSIFNRFGKQRIERGLNCVALVEVCYADAGKRLRRITKPDDIFKLKEVFEPARPLTSPKPIPPQTSGTELKADVSSQSAMKGSGWYTYHPRGCVNGKGIFREMLSRCPQWGYRQVRNADLATQTHEFTHFVNHVLSAKWGQSYGAFYVGDGKFYRLASPNVTIGQVAHCVPAEHRTGRYATYLCGDRVSRNCLSIVDELSCYLNDAQCVRELKLRDDGGLKFAGEFCVFADCLIEAVRTHDPGYADMEKLIAFVDSQKKRVAELSR